MKNICVYCSSSDRLEEHYYKLGRDLAEQIVVNNYALVWGGSDDGLMGVVAKSVKDLGGNTIGIVPKFLPASKYADQVFTARNMHERTDLMEEKSDAFICLPGGFGTTEEVLGVIDTKLHRRHNKPIIFLSSNNFFEHLIAQFKFMFSEGTIKREFEEAYFVACNSKEAFDYISNYVPIDLPQKNKLAED